MSGSSVAPTAPLSPAEMQVLIARAGLTLNPGQIADLVLAWRQIVGLLALIPRDRPLVGRSSLRFPPAPARRMPPGRPTHRRGAPPTAPQGRGASRQEGSRHRPRRRPRPAKKTAKHRQEGGETRAAKVAASRAPRGKAPAPKIRPAAGDDRGPASLTIAEAGRLIAAKKLSPVELREGAAGPHRGDRSAAQRLPDGDREARRWPPRAPPSGR